jgi:hypothetical protein
MHPTWSLFSLAVLPAAYAQQSVWGQCKCSNLYQTHAQTGKEQQRSNTTRRRYRLVRRNNLLIRQHLRSPERLLLAMPARNRKHKPKHDRHNPPHHHLLNPLLQLLSLSLHNNNHHNHQHPHKDHVLLPLPHNQHQRTNLRLRRRLNPPKRLLLDPRRRSPKLPQIPPNLPPKRLPRPRNPLRRNLSRPIPDNRRSTNRANRYQRQQIVRQRRASRERHCDDSASEFHECEELVWQFCVPGRYAYVECGRGAEAECCCLVCV